VEAILPDGLGGEIRDRSMILYFKKDEFGEGILNGALAIAQVIAKDAGVRLTGEPIPKAAPREKSGVSFHKGMDSGRSKWFEQNCGSDAPPCMTR
jgi:uncharacterized protein